jgi:gamma-glutamyltranspeptidase/glutathione hydrolase
VLLLALLNVLEREDPRAGGYRPDQFLHVMIEAEKRLFAVRQGLGDPAFNPGHEERVRQMATKDFAGMLRSQIGQQATPAAQLLVTPEHGTTSISAIDAQGNAISLTTTVNDAFGSCVVARGTGVLLNDQMDDFAVAPNVPNAYGLMGGSENAPAAGKVPLSSMSPTLVFAPSGQLELAIGAAGGASIPTTVAQALIHMIDDHMAVDRAIAQSRIHHNLHPDLVRVEPSGLEAATARALEQRGHVLRFAEEPGRETGDGLFDGLWGKACGVQLDVETGWRIAACDPRRNGGGAIP